MRHKLTLTNLAFALVGLLWMLSALVFLSGAARGDTPSALTAAQRQAAQNAYAAGLKEYAAGRFADAAVAFQEVFEISAQPAVLYNLAQAYRLANYPEAAVSNYKAFLMAVPESPLRPEIEQQIVELRKLIDNTSARERAEAKLRNPAPKWRGPVIGYWTVVRRSYQTDCLAEREKDPMEASALVGPYTIKLGECSVPLTPKGALEAPVTCYGPGGNAMSLVTGHFDMDANTLTLEGKVSRLSSVGAPRSCPVTFAVEFKREPYEPMVRQP